MDWLAPFAAPTAVLLATRLSGLMLIAPLFSSRTVPVKVRAALLVLFTWLLHPLAFASVDAPVLTPAQALGELLVGFAIGLGVAVLVGAAEAMGDLLAVHVGLSGASALDPLTNHSVPVLGQFANLFVLTLLLTLNAHLGMLEALASTLQVMPVGSALEVRAGLGAMLEMGSQLLLLGMRFAAPVVVAVLLANTALAVLSRAAPQLNVLSVAFPIQIGVGLLVLGVSLPLLSTFFAGWAAVYDGMLGRMLGALSGGR